jgi:NAD(P)H-dependent FMN reductase
MLRIAIIVGSTRPNRVGRDVAEWVLQKAHHNEAEFELIDIKDYKLPLLDEPESPAKGSYTQEHTKKWAAKMAEFDAFIFVVPEYNHGINAALKNALDFLYKEWNNKAAAFVSYGSMGGARSVEQLRLVMAELMIADIRAQVMFSLATDFENFTKFKPDTKHEKA